MGNALFTTIGAPIVAGIFAVLVAWFTYRTGRAANKTADWSSFVKEQRETNASQKAEIDNLKGRVGSLEDEVRKERDLRERIVSYARSLLWAWRRQFPGDPPPEAPESIRAYFD